MQITRMRNNQWAIGIGLRRSTIYSTNRWMLWLNYGYKTWSASWKMNPNAPYRAAQQSKGEKQP